MNIKKIILFFITLGLLGQSVIYSAAQEATLTEQTWQTAKNVTITSVRSTSQILSSFADWLTGSTPEPVNTQTIPTPNLPEKYFSPWYSNAYQTIGSWKGVVGITLAAGIALAIYSSFYTKKNVTTAPDSTDTVGPKEDETLENNTSIIQEGIVGTAASKASTKKFEELKKELLQKIENVLNQPLSADLGQLLQLAQCFKDKELNIKIQKFYRDLNNPKVQSHTAKANARSTLNGIEDLLNQLRTPK